MARGLADAAAAEAEWERAMADAAEIADDRFKEDQTHFDVDGWAARAQADLAEAQRLFAAAAADGDEDDETIEEASREPLLSEADDASEADEGDEGVDADEADEADEADPPEADREPEPEPEPTPEAKRDNPEPSEPKKKKNGRFAAMLDADAVEADWSNRGRAGPREPRTPMGEETEKAAAEKAAAEKAAAEAAAAEKAAAEKAAAENAAASAAAAAADAEKPQADASPSVVEAKDDEKEKKRADWDSDKQSFAERVAAARAATSIVDPKASKQKAADTDAPAEAEERPDVRETEEKETSVHEVREAPKGVALDAIPRPAAPPGWWDAHAWPPVATPASEPLPTGSSPSDEPSSEEDEAYWRPSAEQMADESFVAEETSDAASDVNPAAESEDVSSEAHVLRTPAPDSEPALMLSDASLAASERERYAAMLRERTSAARAIREADEPWDYVFEPGDFELCTPRAPTREEKEPFGREYKYLAQNKDGLASEWCDAVFRDGREDPSGACEALEEEEKRTEAARSDSSAEMPPPPPPPPPMTNAEAAEDAEVREPQWRPPQFSVWPRVREEGDEAEEAEEAETRAEAEDDAAAPEAPEEEDASSKTDDDDDAADSSDFEVRAEDFVNPHEGVPFDEEDDDDEWNDAGEGYSSERPWDANRDEEDDETDAEETDAASRADFFERVAAAEAEAEATESAESAETSSASAESAGSADELDASLPPKLPEDKPKGKSKWARLKDD